MRNLTMMTDLYQLTMMYGYYKKGKMDQTVAVSYTHLFFLQEGGAPKGSVQYPIVAA